MSPKNPISTAAIFLSRAVETVRFFLAGYTLQRIKSSRSQTSGEPGEAKQKNAANQQKMACSGAFGTPGWVRTSGLSLRRRPLYPTELRGLIQKIFNFRVQPDSNELPLRRGALYPIELLAHIAAGPSPSIRQHCVSPQLLYCSLPPENCQRESRLAPIIPLWQPLVQNR